MVKTKVTYLGPLAALSHTGPSGVTRTFLRDIPSEDDYSLEDLKFYDKPGKAFKVDKVIVPFRKVVPVTTEVDEEIIIGS